MNCLQVTDVLILKYGKQTFPIKTVSQASEMWNKVRFESMQSGLRPDQMKFTPTILLNGKRVARISWNGRVWKNDGQEWIF